ncbi:hypothetical protein F4810DRAFT_709309 [Camillea tinctor]|nr:hypothetical protein F4810DRAFT_709309 [Camillea tinctor]
MPETSEHAQLPVLIIGSVLEQDPSLSSATRDWAIACHWAVPILAALVGEPKWSRGHARADIDPLSAGRPMPPVKVLNGRSGAVENEIPGSGGHLRRFLRSRLRALIAGTSDDEEEGKLDIGFGKRLERLVYGEDGATVTAHFSDGTKDTGRLVVGADGAQSTVRGLLVAAAALRRLPFGATFVNASFKREKALWLRSFHPVLSTVLHPDNMVGMLGVLNAADPECPESWRFTFYISWRLTPEELEEDEKKCADSKNGGGTDDDNGKGEEQAGSGRRERRAARLRAAKERSKMFADPLRSCFEWLADDHEEVYYSRVTNWDPSLPEHGWDNHGGRVTLVGDAAHPMTYQRGQGLNHALADAGKLVELLAQQHDGASSQADLIHAYETEMRARAGEEVRQSEMNTAMLHDWPRVSQSPLLRQGLERGTGDEKKDTIPVAVAAAAAASPLSPATGAAEP